MTQFIQAFHRTFLAVATLAAYRVVTLNAADNTIEAANAATDIPVGITGHAVTAGDPVRVHWLGSCIAEAGAAITKGAYLTSDSVGRVIATTTAGDKVVGRALEAAGAAGNLIEVQLMPGAVVEGLAA